MIERGQECHARAGGGRRRFGASQARLFRVPRSGCLVDASTPKETPNSPRPCSPKGEKKTPATRRPCSALHARRAEWRRQGATAAAPVVGAGRAAPLSPRGAAGPGTRQRHPGASSAGNQSDGSTTGEIWVLPRVPRGGRCGDCVGTLLTGGHPLHDPCRLLQSSGRVRGAAGIETAPPDFQAPSRVPGRRHCCRSISLCRQLPAAAPSSRLRCRGTWAPKRKGK